MRLSSRNRQSSSVGHGKLDLSGSKIFGPYKLSAKRSDYGVTIDRNGLLNLAKSTATSAGANLASFAGVCVSCLEQVDLCGWVGGMAALCDTQSLEPSVLGQEMGHGYGLDHARLYGSTADYQDPWDVMSTWDSAYMEPNPDFTLIGPGLNAWNMRSRGWLDETRVWIAPPAENWNFVVQLRLRVPQRWDAAIPRACILVHSFQDNHSYLMPAESGSEDIVEGDKFVFGNPDYPIYGYYAAEVVKIDEPNLIATVKMLNLPRHHLPLHPVRIPEAVGQVLGGVQVDGGGIIIIGGKIIKVPPYGPARNLVEEVARYLQIDTATNNVGPALASQRAALEAIVSHVTSLYSDAGEISERPPGYLTDRRPLSQKGRAGRTSKNRRKK